MDVGDAGVLGLPACQQARPGAALAAAGFADEDGAVLVDFLDDGDVSVFAAGSQHSSLEAHHVAQLDGAAGGISVLLGVGRPHVAVAHVGIDRFADLLSSGGGPLGALAHAV